MTSQSEQRAHHSLSGIRVVGDGVRLNGRGWHKITDRDRISVTVPPVDPQRSEVRHASAYSVPRGRCTNRQVHQQGGAPTGRCTNRQVHQQAGISRCALGTKRVTTKRHTGNNERTPPTSDLHVDDAVLLKAPHLGGSWGQHQGLRPPSSHSPGTMGPTPASRRYHGAGRGQREGECGGVRR
ncbi:unnamed protein product [Gadus morhua 'NCC']